MFTRRLRAFYSVTYLFANNHVVLTNRTNCRKTISLYQNIAQISTTIGIEAKLNLKLKRLQKLTDRNVHKYLISLSYYSFYYSVEPQEAKIIDGKKIAEDIRGELRDQVKEWMKKENQRAPHLTAVLVGEDPASHTYVKNKMKVCELILPYHRSMQSLFVLCMTNVM